MKIIDVVVDVVRRKVPAVGLESDLGRFSGEVEQGVLRLLTDEGIEGNCFVGNFRTGGQSDISQIIAIIKPEILGRECTDREWLWSRLGILQRRKGLSMTAWAAVDVAMWDATGKLAGMPIYKLLGQKRSETEVYATYPPRHNSMDGYVAESSEIVSSGFRAYKIHPGVMSEKNVKEMVTAVRAEVGKEIKLMLDPNNNYDFRKALAIGRSLDENGFYWYEDPVPWWDKEAISELKNLIGVPLCMSDTAPDQFRYGAAMIKDNSLRFVRGTAYKLGITGLKKLCSLAEGFGMNCEIGTAQNSYMNAANLHVIFSVENCDFFEYWMPQEAHQFGFKEDVRLTGSGMIEAPNKAGIGYEVDWDWINAHKITSLS